MGLINLMKLKTPNILLNDFWVQILEVIADEVLIERDRVDLKKDYYNIDVDIDPEVDIETLLRIAHKYGYSPNIIVDSSLKFIRDEVKSISFRIKNKNTKIGYELSLRLIKESGAVYNILYNDKALYRAIDYDALKTILESEDLVKPIYLPPVPFFSTSFNDSDFIFDTGYIFDEGDWLFDARIYFLVTRHLSIDLAPKDLKILNSKEYLLHKDYFQYLWAGVHYNRKTTTIPHVGVTFNSFTDTSGTYNSLAGGDYSVPDLKLRSWITPALKRSDGISIEDFIYITAGIGTKGGISVNTPDLLNKILAYYSFDQESGTTVIDTGFQKNDLIITGNSNRSQGVIGKALKYDGLTYCTGSGLVIAQENHTVQFWLCPDTTYNNKETVLDLGFIKVEVEGRYLIGTVIGDSGDVTNQFYFDGLDSTDSGVQIGDLAKVYYDRQFFIQLELDFTNNKFNLYVNKVLSVVVSISAIGSIEGTYDINIGHSATDKIFTSGTIDEVSIHNTIFTSDEKSQWYDNQVGDLSVMGNRVFRRRIQPEEKKKLVTNNKKTYLIAHGIIETNSVNDEPLGIGSGTYQEFSITARFGGITPKTIRFHLFNEQGNPILLFDDGNGDVAHNSYSAVIDYETGEILFNTSKILYYNITVSLPPDEDGNSSYSLNSSISPQEFNIYYSYGDIGYSASSNEDGEIIPKEEGNPLNLGTVNYNTGEITLSFGSNPVDDNFHINYQVDTSTFIPEGKEVTYEYKIEGGMDITEVGIENKDKILQVYSTFPPINSESSINHISPSFIIDNHEHEDNTIYTSDLDGIVTSDGMPIITSRV